MESEEKTYVFADLRFYRLSYRLYQIETPFFELQSHRTSEAIIFLYPFAGFMIGMN